MSYVLIWGKDLYIHLLPYRLLSLILKHKKEGQRSEEILRTLLLELLFHLRWQHLNQFNPILNLESLLYLGSMYNILPYLIMQLPIYLIGLHQPPQR